MLLTIYLSICYSFMQNPLPAEYYEIPEATRNKATLVFRGEYFSSRKGTVSPKGLRKWTPEYGFVVKETYAGIAANDTVSIPNLPQFKPGEQGLMPQYMEQGKQYLVLLAPLEMSNKRKSEIVFREIVAIKEIKGKG